MNSEQRRQEIYQVIFMNQRAKIKSLELQKLLVENDKFPHIPGGQNKRQLGQYWLVTSIWEVSHPKWIQPYGNDLTPIVNKVLTVAFVHERL